MDEPGVADVGVVLDGAHGLGQVGRGLGRQLLGYMDEVYSLLVTIDFPDAMTGGLRRTTDALRGVLERTRGDLTTSLLQSRLLAGIEARAQEQSTGG